MLKSIYLGGIDQFSRAPPPWALDRPANAVFPLRIETGRDPMLPNMLPYISRPIPAGGSETFAFSLRFGPRGASALTLGGDVLQWKDRRPVGTVMLSTVRLNSPTNPRGWFQAPELDVTTEEEGRAEFRSRLLHLADSIVLFLRDMTSFERFVMRASA